MNTKTTTPGMIATDNTPAATLSTCSSNCGCHSFKADDIAKEMKKAIEGSEEYQTALFDYGSFVEKKQRIENAIKQLTAEEAALHEEKAQLSANFGEEDPQADTDRLEAINNRLLTINESRDLLAKRMEHNGNVTRQKQDMESRIKVAILQALPDIQKRYQAKIDKQVENLIKSIEAYSGALTSIRNCKTKDGDHRVYIGSLSTARIEIKDVYKLEKLSDDMPVI